MLLGGFGLLVWRLPTLRTPARLDSAVSREAAFIGNNMLLLTAAAIILLGTAFPLVVEAVSGEQVTVGGPYFRGAIAPVFLLVLLLVGTAPLLPWRATNRSRALRRLRVPTAAAALVIVVTAAAGVHQVRRSPASAWPPWCSSRTARRSSTEWPLAGAAAGEARYAPCFGAGDATRA